MIYVCPAFFVSTWQNMRLSCVVDGAGLADDRDFDLTGVGHLVLYLFGYFSRELLGLGIVNLVCTYNDAEFAAACMA